MIINRQRRVSLDEHDLGSFAQTLARTVGISLQSFTVSLVSDQGMAKLNGRFRGRSQATDVLSFPASSSPGTNGYVGDIAISAETARRNARRLRHSLGEEVKLLMLHGVLHLLGYDHETDRGQMNRREHRLRRQLGLE